MHTRIASLLIGAMTAVMLVAAPVAAGDGRAVITLDVNFNNGTESFTATGAFCPSGTATSTVPAVTGGGAFGAGALVFHLAKTFTCSDRSGTLTVELNATTSALFDGTSGGWSVKGGTGAYAGATGGGQITGVNTSTGILDTYTGTINR